MLIISADHPKSCKLQLQTSERNDIDNEQFKFLSNYEFSQISSFEKKYPNAIHKGNPTSIYNCHGFTFASKRTGIFEDSEIEKILKDDNYIEVKAEKDVLPGDVIIYYENSNITHSGIVISAKVQANDLAYITVISKWSKYKEVIHDANYSPYSTGFKKYWRINHGFKII